MEKLVHLPSLSEDLVTEILQHLPVKSLLRFRCVSKHWCNLFKSPHFINGHLRKERSSMMLMLRVWKKRNRRKDPDNMLVLTFHDVNSPELEVLWPNLSTPIFPGGMQFGYSCLPHLLGPCEGLLCIVRNGHAFVCNPALRQFILIPTCPYLEYNCYFNPYGKGYFEMVSPDHWGFVNIDNNSFKVVQLDCLSREYGHGDERVRKLLIKPYLYESGTGSWRQINDSGILLSFHGTASSELTFNGTCHWHILPNFERQMRPGIILAFEISTEIFRQFECPLFLKERQLECPDEELNEWYEGSNSLMVLNECLAMVWFPNSKWLPLEVWVMKEYGVEESWTRQFVVEKCTMSRPFLFWKNDESLLMEGVQKDGELVSYDFSTEDIMKFQIDGVEYIAGTRLYKDSLISLK